MIKSFRRHYLSFRKQDLDPLLSGSGESDRDDLMLFMKLELFARQDHSDAATEEQFAELFGDVPTLFEQWDSLVAEWSLITPFTDFLESNL